MPQPASAKVPAPLIVVVSGPSGVGKTVICDALMEQDPHLVRSISATTRAPRPGERDGEDYYFWPEERFRDGVAEGLFLEWAEVHGRRYGTLQATVDNHLRRGRSVLLNVDVQGGHSVKTMRPESVLVFVLPPSMEELESRLRHRGTDDDASIERRLNNARAEVEAWERYDYLVINDRLEDAVNAVASILTAERCRVSRRRAGLVPGI